MLTLGDRIKCHMAKKLLRFSVDLHLFLKLFSNTQHRSHFLLYEIDMLCVTPPHQSLCKHRSTFDLPLLQKLFCICTSIFLAKNTKVSMPKTLSNQTISLYFYSGSGQRMLYTIYQLMGKVRQCLCGTSVDDGLLVSNHNATQKLRNFEGVFSHLLTYCETNAKKKPNENSCVQLSK